MAEITALEFEEKAHDLMSQRLEEALDVVHPDHVFVLLNADEYNRLKVIESHFSFEAKK